MFFRLQETRTVSNDWVVRYDNRLLQLERQSGRPPARGTVLVDEAIDGQLEIRYRVPVMRWTEIRPAADRPGEAGGGPSPTGTARGGSNHAGQRLRRPSVAPCRRPVPDRSASGG